MSLSTKQLKALEAILQDKPGVLSAIKVYNLTGNEQKLKSVCLEAAGYLQSKLKSIEPVSIPAQMGQTVMTPKPAFKFDPRPSQDNTPKPFNWQSFGVNAVNRLLGKV